VCPSQRFGIHYVDYDNNLARYPKDSAKWYTQLIANTTGNPRRLAREQAEKLSVVQGVAADGQEGVSSADKPNKVKRARRSQKVQEL
jgi:hypothetical protein